MVQLEQVTSRNLRVSKYFFQFHYGSIRTQHLQNVKLSSLRFQFHYGSIRTGVRSKRFVYVRPFNSIMVQLERFENGFLAFPLSVFQFHYGSIRTLV